MSAAPSAAQAAQDLIDATPASVSITAPAPGETVTWDMSVRNLTSGALPIELSISGDDGRLLQGPTPIMITIRESGTSLVVAEGSPQELLGSSWELPSLVGGAEYALVGSATLPQNADNSYQAASATLDFRFTAVSSEGPTALAITGSDLVGVVGVVAVGAVAVLSGLWLTLSRRRKETHA
ncbi:hypothetical protein [Microbacterium binotii]|uniref:hypothetical protein n=1 Tax=Microbacterium binotii TaxID=462710 RepID=UPI001F482F56|nr:hypothetical protein [Microbacterium binotii]UIN30694.1 hypothetical protein LXM64_00360 [Microbacterium binotii]